MHDGRDGDRRWGADSQTLPLQRDAFGIEALTLALGASTAASTFALHTWGRAICAWHAHRRGWHAHYLIGDPVSFLFMEIARSVDLQFCLQARTRPRFLPANLN